MTINLTTNRRKMQIVLEALDRYRHDHLRDLTPDETERAVVISEFTRAVQTSMISLSEHDTAQSQQPSIPASAPKRVTVPPQPKHRTAGS